jgi:DNA helicase-2/ATP-dependent DNA helicase PcrA
MVMSGGQNTFQKHYEKLNEAQKEAVDTIEGPVLVVAGPGSGKTEILSVRAANILKKSDAYASDILCLTFTESAEINMRERMSEIIGSEANYVNVHTFHNFCRRIRERHPDHFGVTTDFSVADDIVRTEILGSIFTGLDHDNPLRSEHPEIGFVYMKSVMSALDDIKQAGLSPDEFASVLEANKEFIEAVRADVNDVFSQRVSKSIFEDVENLLAVFADNKVDSPVSHFRSLGYALSVRLEKALNKARDEDSTKSITKAKKDLTKKDGEKRILRAEKDQEKLFALADVYRQYEQEKHRQGFYDFADMILEVIQKLESNSNLCSEVAEEHPYIMVDEFQDTNDAQLRLLLALAQQAPNNRPNLMVVGDDDQAIYRFQGAEVSNILKFKHRFEDPEIITLTKNYRSGQNILDTAQSVIAQSDERLSAMLDQAKKDLTAASEPEEDVQITKYDLPTRTHHNRAVASRVSALIEDGVSAEEIAVIGRKHSDLEALVPYFHEAEVPITYERQQNVLDQPHIRQLITMCRFVYELNQGSPEQAETYLPEILSYPFWELDRTVVWELSLQANKQDTNWLKVMDERGGEPGKVADFLRDVAASATHEPVEHVLDMLVGAHVEPVADTADADTIDIDKGSPDFVSPFKSYYFPQNKLESNPDEYLRFLSSLKTFIFSLREHKEQQVLLVEDLLDFVDTHKDNDLVVTDTSPFVNSADAVNLMTAHKAKGQEFESVIIIGAVDDVWANSRSYNRIRFPSNLPIQFSGDTIDDQLRLLFVAMTRAKRTLDMYSFSVDDSGDEQVQLSFLADLDIDEKTPEENLPSTEALLESTVPTNNSGPFVDEEEALLKPLVENYRLSVTHLNNFIDVRYGGPQEFLASNLLRFPQPMSRSQVYGAAIHEVLERIYTYLKKEGKHPDKDEVIAWFTDLVKTSSLSEQDRSYLLERGKDSLETFLEDRLETFKPEHFSEYNFANESVVVDDVPLTGKIDKLVVEEQSVAVHDFKTGKPIERFTKASGKSMSYERQLVFYKLLVENTAEFRDKEVDTGVLEFVEPKDGEIVTLDKEITGEDTDRLRELIQVVYDHIINLNFPDVSVYDETATGVRNFIDDLLQREV